MFYIWHKHNNHSCHTYIMLKCAEWQLYLLLQTSEGTKTRFFYVRNSVFTCSSTWMLPLMSDEKPFKAASVSRVSLLGNTNIQFSILKLLLVSGDITLFFFYCDLWADATLAKVCCSFPKLVWLQLISVAHRHDTGEINLPQPYNGWLFNHC